MNNFERRVKICQNHFCQNNIQTDTIMENNYYETPQLEVLEIAVEQGFATSTVDYKEGWDL